MSTFVFKYLYQPMSIRLSSNDDNYKYTEEAVYLILIYKTYLERLFKVNDKTYLERLFKVNDNYIQIRSYAGREFGYQLNFTTSQEVSEHDFTLRKKE